MMEIQKKHQDWILRQTMNFLNESSQNWFFRGVLSNSPKAIEQGVGRASLPSSAYWDLHFDSINYTREVNDLFPEDGFSKRTQKAFNHFKTSEPQEASPVVGMS